MWIVRLALRRPYTFVVAALLLVILGIVTIAAHVDRHFSQYRYSRRDRHLVVDRDRRRTMSKSGLLPLLSARFTTTVNDIEHLESHSMYGVGVIKVFFHPSAKVEMAVAQITAISQAILRGLPPGFTPPLIIRYSASSVPILQLSVTSKTLPEEAALRLRQ